MWRSVKEKWRSWSKKNADSVADVCVIIPLLLLAATIAIILFGGLNILTAALLIALIIPIIFSVVVLLDAADTVSTGIQAACYTLSERRIKTLENVGVPKDITEFLTKLLNDSKKKEITETRSNKDGWLANLEKEIGRRRFADFEEVLLEYTRCEVETTKE